MAKLNDTALTILASAGSRKDARALPLPAGLKTHKTAVRKVLEQLLAGELLAEVPAGQDDEEWRESDESGRTTLIITPSGLAAIGIEDGQEAAPVARGKAPKPAAGRQAPTAAKKRAGATRPKGRDTTVDRAVASTPRSSVGVSKQDAVVQLLRQKQGTSIAEIMAATGWQAHSVRGFLSGTVKTKMKLTVTSEKDKAGERRYRIGKAGRG